MIPGTGFGLNVKQARERNGWSRAELLRRLSDLGVDMYAMTIKRIEDGEQVAKVHEAVGLARVFGTTVEKLENMTNDELIGKLKQAEEALACARSNALDGIEGFISAENDLRRLVEAVRASRDGGSYIESAVESLNVAHAYWAQILQLIGGK